MWARQLAVLTLLLGCASGCAPGFAVSVASEANRRATKTRITGAGASFPEPIYAKWAGAYARDHDVHVNYQPIGSGGGISQIKARTVDFGASDAPLTAEELEAADLIQFPMVVGGVVPVVRLDGVEPGSLRLTPEILVQILMGEIRRWDAPEVARLNPDVDLPARDVTVVYRSDPSGTTWILTHYLAAVSEQWRTQVGAGKAVQWPVGIAGKGNQGVATYVTRVDGAIGYVEQAFVELADLTHVRLQNQAGEFVAPTRETVAAAAANADWASAAGFHLKLVNQPGAQSWPIAGATFILLNRQQDDLTTARAVLEFFAWCYEQGGSLALELGYLPMPQNVVELVAADWKREVQFDGRPIAQ